VVLIAVFMFSGCFTVGPQEKAVILRRGKIVGEGEKRLLSSGWHWGLPYPIDEVIKIPITEIQQVKSTVGWFAMTAVQEATGQEPMAGASLNPAVDGYVITADANIVHLSAILSYRIEDPVQCVFSFARGTNSTLDLSGVSYNVQNALNNALVQTAARFNVDDILTRDRLGFQDAVRKRVIKLVDDQKLGVVIESCPVTPRVPRQTDDAFRKVTTAIQSRATAIDNARSYTNQILSRAAADASAMTNIAVVEAARTVAEAKADAIQFAALLPRWKQNRDLFVQQKLVESMGRALTNVADKAYMPSALNNAPTQLRIDLNREAPKPKQAPPTQ